MNKTVARIDFPLNRRFIVRKKNEDRILFIFSFQQFLFLAFAPHNKTKQKDTLLFRIANMVTESESFFSLYSPVTGIHL